MSEPSPVSRINGFTRDEFIAALQLVMPEDKAREAVASLFAETAGLNQRPLGAAAGVHVDGYGLTMLSLVSDECAQRVQQLVGLTAHELLQRQREFKERQQELRDRVLQRSEDD